nr:hypothetical protein [Tanacetum cinerariifolium]
TRKIMKTIHVKFDELTAMDSEHNCLEPETNCFNNDDSSADYTSIPSKEDLDNLFGLMYEEYFEKISPEVFIKSTAKPTLIMMTHLCHLQSSLKIKRLLSLYPL